MNKKVRWVGFLVIVSGIFVGGIGASLLKGQSINWPWLISNTALVAAGFYYLLIFRKTRQQEEINASSKKKTKKKRK